MHSNSNFQRIDRHAIRKTAARRVARSAVLRRSNPMQMGQSSRAVPLVLTEHAQDRCQQRGISAKDVSLIMRYGYSSHDGRNGIRYFVSKVALGVMLESEGYSAALERLSGVYIVVAIDSPLVITVAHRH